MTTLQRDIRMEVRQVLAKYGIDNLQMEMDLASVIRPFVEAGKKYINGKRGDLVDLATLATNSPELRARLLMRVRVENALHRNIDWEDLKQDWNTLDRWLVDTENESGQTIEAFVKWHNGDPFRAKGVIYLTPQKIMDWWGQAFEVKTDEARPAYNPIPERVRTPRPAHIPPPNIPKRSINDNTADRE